jgi:hypothetical protein
MLKPPSFSGYREKPDASEYHLPLSGTDFIVRLPLTNKMPSTPPNKVFATLMQLLATPGRSLLQIATYSDPEDGDHYRLRLLTEHNGQFQTVAESELSAINWTAERIPLRHEIWMRLISHLLHRISYRAYFQVHERLKHYRWYAKQIAAEEWNYKDSFDPKRFLASHLHIVTGYDAGKKYAEAVIPQDLEGEGEYTFTLPCGHEQDMFIEDLGSLSIGECLHVGCELCGERFARSGDEWRYWLLAHRQRLRRARFSVRELVWKRIAEFPIGDHQASVSSAVLYKALQYAADSGVPPESASPYALHPANSTDFSEVVSAFFSQIRGDYEVKCTSAEVFSEFVDKLDRAVGRVQRSGHLLGNLQSLPRAWEGLVLLWLTRATQLAGIPGYDGREPLTVFESQTVEDEGSVHGDDEGDEERREIGLIVCALRPAIGANAARALFDSESLCLYENTARNNYKGVRLR